jgi:heme A synthase
MKKLAWVAFGGVVAQALLGGVRVILGEQGKLYISVPHALVAQSFFGTLVAIAVFTSKSWVKPISAKIDSVDWPLRRMTVISIAAVLAQLVLGAGFRHRVFGIIPHVIGAVVVAALILWTVTLVMRHHGRDTYLRKPAMALFGLLFAQLSLGVCAYLARLASADDPQPLEPMITLTVAHVVIGATTLAILILLTLRCYRVLTPVGTRFREVAEARSSAARRATA